MRSTVERINAMNTSLEPRAAGRGGLLGLLLLTGIFALPLAACNGTGDSSDDTPPPAPAPPTPPATFPPLAATAIDIDDGHMVGSRYWPDRDTSVGGQGQPVAGLECGTMVETYHVHSHLSVLLNGEALAVPALVGIVDTSPTSECTYNAHTHDLSGKLHVEAPAAATFTLGQFFGVWGQPLERNDIAGLRDLPVVVYVVDGGVVSEYDGDLAAIELKSHRLIAIQVGTPITEIPNFTWSAN